MKTRKVFGLLRTSLHGTASVEDQPLQGGEVSFNEQGVLFAVGLEKRLQSGDLQKVEEALSILVNLNCDPGNPNPCLTQTER